MARRKNKKVAMGEMSVLLKGTLGEEPDESQDIRLVKIVHFKQGLLTYLKAPVKCNAYTKLETNSSKTKNSKYMSQEIPKACTYYKAKTGCSETMKKSL